MKTSPQIAASRVRYEHSSGSRITVERLPFDGRAIDPAVAQRMMRLNAAALKRQLEDRLDDRILPPGTMAHHFDTGSRTTVDAYAERVRSFVASGSDYWVVGGNDREGAYGFDAMAKTSPSRATYRQKFGIQPPNCYVNDILVQPNPGVLEHLPASQQVRDYGAAVLHTALKYGNYAPEVAGASDPYAIGDGSDMDLLSVSGFTSVGPAEHAIFNQPEGSITPVPLRRVDIATIGEATAHLEEHFPWLQNAGVDYPI